MTTWFSGVAEELARCVTDAQASAAACEALLESTRNANDDDAKRVVHALVAPAAIARVLIELIDQPPELVLAACRLCRDSASQAVGELEALDLDSSTAEALLRASAESCEELLRGFGA